MRLFANRKSKSSPRWTFFTWYDIVINGELYLTRFNILQTPWFGIKLHWIHKPDPDRGLHDHPWPFVSFVLRGWYKEFVSDFPPFTSIKKQTIKWFNFKNTFSAHRICEVSGKTLTLVITGPRSKSWGFYDDSGNYIDWKDVDRKEKM